MTWFSNPTESQDYFRNRPHIVDNAMGYVATLGLKAFQRKRDDFLADFQSFFNAAETNEAFLEYETDFLIKNCASRFPAWPKIEGSLNWCLGVQNLADYTNVIKNKYKANAGWAQIDHVCAFILRLQLWRLKQEKEKDLEPWTIADYWAATFVLGDMLYWRQLKAQRRYIVERDLIDAASKAKVIEIVNNVLGTHPAPEFAPLIESQAPKSWSFSGMWT
ncbi:hypothetical protein BJ170DRAFT_695189 [Xylariales sp. AK1849]|nr:hypothetical protein BJ170DRAFT_695189 [Xylariales sp. AK1849]